MNALVMMEHTPSAVAAVPGVSSSDKQLTAAYPPSSPRGALIAAGRAADARPGGRTRATDGGYGAPGSAGRGLLNGRGNATKRACRFALKWVLSPETVQRNGGRRNDDVGNGRESLVPTTSAALKSSLARARILPASSPTV